MYLGAEARGNGPRGLRGAFAAGWMISVAPLALGVMVPAAQAQDDVRDFRIPPQDLATALTSFGQQSGLQVSAPGALIEGRVSNGVEGSLAPLQALSRLLDGTGLTFRISGSAVTLEAAPRSRAGDVQIGTLRVEGSGGASGAGGRGSGIGDGSGSQFGDGGDTGDLAYVSPQSSSYLTRDEIERNRGFQASDMFRGTPGVLSGDSRNSGALDINIRGMQGMSRVPVVIDGSQQSTTVYRGYSGVASRAYVDPDVIGGVEVFKGPTSGADGVGAVGGVVRMRTINANDILLPGKTFGIRLRGGFSTNTRSAPEPFTTGGLQTTSTGSFLTGCNYANCGTIVPMPTIESVNELGNERGLDRPSWAKPTGGNGSIAVAKTWDAVDLVGAFTYRNTGNYFAGTHGNAPELTITQRTSTLSGGRERYFTVVGFDAQLNRYRAGEEVLNTSSKNISFLGKATIRPADDHGLELGFMNYQSWFGELMPSSIIRGTGALQAPMSKVDLDSYTARYKWDAATNLVDLRINASRTELDNRIRTAYNFFGIDDPMYNFIQTYDARTHRTGVDITNRSILDGPWGALSLDVGGTFSYETTKPIPGNEDVVGDGAARNGWRREWSGFADAEWSPVEFLKFNGGIRYQTYHSYDRKEWFYYQDNTRISYNIENDDDGWAPYAAITMSPRTWLQVYARYAQAIRMPSLFEVTVGWSQNPSPNIDVRPERARNWEFGANVSKNGLLFNADELRAKIAYFSSDVKDYLTRAASGDDVLDRGEQLRNIDRARFKGYEATLEYRQGPLALELFGTHYSFTQFCYWNARGTSSNPLPPTYACMGGAPGGSYARNHVPPEWAGGGSINLSLFDKRLNLFGRVTYMGRRPDEAVGTAGAITVVQWTPYTLVDASVNFKLSDHVRFELVGDNLTDKYYMDALTLGLMASPGRTLRAGVTLNF